jgi:hypothetical protein
MRMKNIILPLCILLSALLAKAEDDNVFVATQNLKVGLEMGSDVLFGGTKAHPRIREISQSYSILSGLSALRSTYGGAKAEYFFVDNRLGIAFGMRVTKFTADYSRLSSDGNFLWLLREENGTTDLVRLTNITQNSYSFGFPMELRWFPNARELPVQIYFKAGMVVDWCVSTKNTVVFEYPAMQRYADEVSKTIGAHDALSAHVFLGLGMKIGGFRMGSYSFPWINVEMYAFNASLTRNSFEFIEPQYGIGWQASIQIPIGKNMPIGSS